METLALKLFILLFQFLGLQNLPSHFQENWTITKNWEQSGSQYVLEAQSQSIIEHCKANPNDVLIFPQIIHSAQVLKVDGISVAELGKANQSASSPFYQQLAVPCSQLSHGQSANWTVYSYSFYFSRLNEAPYFEKNIWGINFLNVTANFLAFGVLIILSLFTLIIFKNRVSNELTFSVSLGSFFLALYFAHSANLLLGADISMLSSHKIADISLWMGIYFFYRAFEADHFSPKISSRLVRVSIFLGITTIITGGNGDVVQLGTIMPMAPLAIALMTVVDRIYRNIKNRRVKRHLYSKIFSVLCFLVFGLNDIFHVNGIINTGMALNFGIVGCIFGLVVSVAQGIDLIYRERDEMRIELEAWAPPFILKALKYEKIKFPIRKDLAAITYDIVASSQYHGVYIDGKPIRAVILQGFSEIILKLGGWRESHAGDSAYAHFGILPSKNSPNELAYEAALLFKKFLDELNAKNQTQIHCGIGLHFAKDTLINVHTIAQKINEEVVQQKSFDTTSTDVDLVHRIENLVHAIPGTNIAMSEVFFNSLKLPKDGFSHLGTFKLKGQDQEISIFLVKNSNVSDEFINNFKKVTKI